MGFVKRDVKDRIVQYGNRYKLTEVSPDVYDLTPVTGTVTEQGTIINKAYLQPIENHLEKTRKIHFSTADAVVSGMEDGEIWIKHS